MTYVRRYLTRTLRGLLVPPGAARLTPTTHQYRHRGRLVHTGRTSAAFSTVDSRCSAANLVLEPSNRRMRAVTPTLSGAVCESRSVAREVVVPGDAAGGCSISGARGANWARANDKYENRVQIDER
jgi:hypothetical protein